MNHTHIVDCFLSSLCSSNNIAIENVPVDTRTPPSLSPPPTLKVFFLLTIPMITSLLNPHAQLPLIIAKTNRFDPVVAIQQTVSFVFFFSRFRMNSTLTRPLETHASPNP